MTNGIKEILNNSQLANDSFKKRDLVKNVSLDEVDRLSDELVRIYKNPSYKKWYCKAIYRFGAQQIRDWMARASDGKYPERLFTTYVNQANGFIRGDGQNVDLR
jgi:hypothetical protein